jgi:hypothetical protein
MYNLHLKDNVDRVGIFEDEDIQNIGYLYSKEDFLNTFYSSETGEYGPSSDLPSLRGTSYMLREVVDYLTSQYSLSSLTWYDIFTRMPMTRVGELFYDMPSDLLLKLSLGYRSGVPLLDVEEGNESLVLDDDSKTIVTAEDRLGISTVII